MLARDIMTREVYVARPDDEVDRIARPCWITRSVAFRL